MSSISNDATKAAKGMSENPSSVLKALAVVLEIATPHLVPVISALRLSDNTIKVISTLGLPDKWANYSFKRIFQEPAKRVPLLVKDIASTITSVAAIPKLLHTFHLIDLGKFSANLGCLPYVSFLGKIPGNIVLNLLEILCSAITIYEKTTILVSISNHSRHEKICRKLDLWGVTPDNFNAIKDGTIRDLFVKLRQTAPYDDDAILGKILGKKGPDLQKSNTEQVFKERYKELDQDDLSRAVEAYKVQKKDKWLNRANKLDQKVISSALSIAFRVSLIAMMTLLIVVALIGTAPVLPILIKAAGCSAALFGLACVIYDAIRPDVKGVRFSPPLATAAAAAAA